MTNRVAGGAEEYREWLDRAACKARYGVVEMIVVRLLVVHRQDKDNWPPCGQMLLSGLNVNYPRPDAGGQSMVTSKDPPKACQST